MKTGLYLLHATLFEGEAEKVILKTTGGEITVLKNHSPLVALVAEGEVRIKTEAEEKIFPFPGGVVEVNPSEVVILAKHL